MTIAATNFAPAERATQECIQQQTEQLADMPLLGKLYDAVVQPVIILNQQRQIVFCNQAFSDLLGLGDRASVYGLRPGEAVGCAKATAPGGCGTSEFCHTCGAVNAILSAQTGKADTRECRIQNTNGDALDLLVRTTPVELDDEYLTVFAVSDLSDQKRRRALERVFFHDLMNTATGLELLSDVLASNCLAEDRKADFKTANTICKGVEQIIEVIASQRDLLAAESSELPIRPVQISSLAIFEHVLEISKPLADAALCNLSLDAAAQDVNVQTDIAIVSRVLGNMVKNALEASKPNDTVTVGCELSDGCAFWVHNPTFMPREVQLQVFGRSFSTKGSGRGLGTYSMKLLSERYLKGQVSFTTSPEAGTRFIATYPLVLIAE